MIFRNFCGLLFLSVLPGWGGAQPSSITRADQQLGDLLTIQRELLARAAEAEVQEDVETLRPRLQNLVFDWEEYLRIYEDKPEGYIAYSMLLGNPLIDERNRAKALLLKANSLDPNRAIVKNQLGKYLAEDGLPLQALPYFLAAVELEPNEPLYHYQVGQLLAGARESFLESGEWSVESIDKAMQGALSEAVRLDPESLPYAYRYAESFYDLETPPWAEAMQAWVDLEERVETDTEKRMMRLHQANVRLFQGELDAAEALLAESMVGVLSGQRERLLARLERLRNPPEPTEVVDAEADSMAAGEMGPEATVATVAVPKFAPVDMPMFSPVNSAGVVELHENSQLGEVVGSLWPEGGEAGSPAPEMSGVTPDPRETGLEVAPAAAPEESAD